MKIVRYALVGGVAAGVDFALFALFAGLLGLNYLWVAAGSFLVATAVNYLLSVRHVFVSGVRFRRETEIAMVFLVSGVGLLLNQVFLWLCVETLGLGLLVSKILATGSVFLWNFGARNYFVFQSR